MGALTELSEQIDQVLKGYAEALLWANAVCEVESCEDGRDTGSCEHTDDAHLNYGLDDFRAEDAAEMRTDVEDFVLSNLNDFREYLTERGYRPEDGTVAEHFGHDFALTRNGHGTGFWDRGLDELGDRLAAAAKVYGTSTVMIGEDGPIGLMG